MWSVRGVECEGCGVWSVRGVEWSVRDGECEGCRV